jgi:hypothetical protein
VPVLFGVAILVGSFLLFLVQPMFGRIVLPMLGGSAAVWNTCMMFFQLALLAGYLYAHLSIRFLGPRRSAIAHIVLLVAAILFVPLSIDPASSPPAGNPIGWLLVAMSLTVGPPFVLLSANAPLLQRWYAAVRTRSSGDPYFLYAASNAGSLAALLAYPFFVEPRLRLSGQIDVWAMGFAIMTGLATLAAIMMWLRPAPRIERGDAQSSRVAAPPAAARPVTLGRRLRWVALAFVPSSLMLGVTAHITMDLVSAPLVWVLPLSLYLLSFILVFARRAAIPHRLILRILPLAIVIEVVLVLLSPTQPILLIVPVHLLVFFIAAMACHGELAHDRPDASRLTEFYFWLSVGGALGGVFNAILAPMIFDSIAEYPIAIVLLALLAPAAIKRRIERDKTDRANSAWLLAGDMLTPLAVGVGALLLIVTTGLVPWLPQRAMLWLTAGIPAVFCFLLAARPARFGLGIGALFLAWRLAAAAQGEIIVAERSFFGVHRVARLELHGGEPVHAIFHGTTLHGMQRVDPSGAPIQPGNPRAYYHTDSPIARLFALLEEAGRAPHRVGIVGLGAGGLAAFVGPGQHLTYFEIDPVVGSLAEDTRLFTFLSEARERGAAVDVVIGDARLTIESRKGELFDLLIVDAFSSDAIPVHLLTREAMELYLDRIAPEGLIVFHISSRHFDLEPVLGNVCAGLGVACLVKQYDTLNEDEEKLLGRYGSKWIAMTKSARTASMLQPSAIGQRWERARTTATPVWTDDYSNVISAIDW